MWNDAPRSCISKGCDLSLGRSMSYVLYLEWVDLKVGALHVCGSLV